MIFAGFLTRVDTSDESGNPVSVISGEHSGGREERRLLVVSLTGTVQRERARERELKERRKRDKVENEKEGNEGERAASERGGRTRQTRVDTNGIKNDREGKAKSN